MYDLIDSLSLYYPHYMLVFIRIATILTVMPVFGYATVSGRVRILLAAALTLVVAPVVVSGQLPVYGAFLELAVAAAREVFIGLIIGFGTRLLFEAFAFAGAFVGMQLGIAIMNVFDPTTEQQSPILSNFWMMVMMLFFLATNSHHFLVETVCQNFAVVPPGGGTFSPQLGQTIVHGAGLMYEVALRFAAPALVFLMLMEFCFGFMARVMPQMNIFFVSLPLKIGVGLVVIILSLKLFQSIFGYLFGEMETLVAAILQNM